MLASEETRDASNNQGPKRWRILFILGLAAAGVGRGDEGDSMVNDEELVVLLWTLVEDCGDADWSSELSLGRPDRPNMDVRDRPALIYKPTEFSLYRIIIRRITLYIHEKLK